MVRFASELVTEIWFLYLIVTVLQFGSLKSLSACPPPPKSDTELDEIS